MTQQTLMVLMNASLIAGGLFALYGLYFCIVAVFGLKKGQHLPAAKPKTRFAIVVAARNEAAVIGQLLDSLQTQQYPKALYDVYVAPNNCTDDTKGVAVAHGAKIFSPKGKITMKGQVLQQISTYLLKLKKYDAMCVFDADNLVHPNFLQKMNDAYQNGAQAAQGQRHSKNPTDSAMATCYAIYYWVVNRFYNGGREALGLSSLVVGSGYMVSTELLGRLGGWNTQTITEDYEFSAQCVLAGEKVHYVADAIAYDELPLTFAQSWKQRRRWVTGFVQSMRLYMDRLFACARQRRSAVVLDVALAYVAPVVQLASLLCGLVSMMLSAYGIFEMHLIPATQAVLLLLATVAALFVVCVLFGALVMRISHPKIHMLPIVKGLALFAVFLVSWLPITLISLFKGQTKWEAIHHTRAIGLSSLNP